MIIKKFVKEILLIAGLSVVLGILFNIPLIKRYFAGEFQINFISADDYPNISFIYLPEAEALFAERNAVFIDSRSQESYKQGHVMGALNLPFEEFDDLVFEKITFSTETTVVIYCDGNECQSSTNLAKALHSRDFSDIRVFFGGWLEWKESGLPVDVDY